MRAIPLFRSGRFEVVTARGALSRPLDVPTAVCRERRRAVRTHDAEVLEPVIVADPVDVVEDQRKPASAPQLALPAELAALRLKSRRVQPLLEMAARERRALDEDL
jgi:hypothetical protein